MTAKYKIKGTVTRPSPGIRKEPSNNMTNSRLYESLNDCPPAGALPGALASYVGAAAGVTIFGLAGLTFCGPA